MNSVEVIVRKRKIKGIGNLEQSVGQSGFLGYRSCNVNLRLLHIDAPILAEGDGAARQTDIDPRPQLISSIRIPDLRRPRR